MVLKANEENCNLFVVAGDLFTHIKGIRKKTIVQTAEYLRSFRENVFLVLPGNHDYENDMIDLWKTFRRRPMIKQYS